MRPAASRNDGSSGSGKAESSESHLVVVDDGFEPKEAEPWPVLVVDDEQDIHRLVRLICSDIRYQDRPIEIIDVFTAAEARQTLTDRPGIALVILDVMMETDSAGLDLVDFIRSDLEDDGIQIVLFTGQPGLAPERRVIRDYDINGYVNKADVASESMRSAVITSLRFFSDRKELAALARHQENQQKLLHERNNALMSLNAELQQALKFGAALQDKVAGLEAEIDAKVLEQTRRLSMEKEQVEMENVAKSEYISNVCHELRNPLQAIVGYSNMLLISDDRHLTLEERGKIAEIGKASQHMMALVNNHLSLAAMESNGPQPDLGEIDLRELISDAIDIMQVIAREHRVKLQGDMPDRIPEVIGDKTQTQQALINLLSNAVNYNYPGGIVQVIVRIMDQSVRITVKDTGIGIPEALQDRLFKPFDRLSIDSDHSSGSGLGLTITRKLLEAQGSSIAFTSEEGKGSSFFFELRRVDGGAA